MKTAVIYARYSCDRQTEQSIDGQIHVCMEYAERNDIVIVGTYVDRAMTGTNDNREQFQKMLKDSDKKPFDYVLVFDTSGNDLIQSKRKTYEFLQGSDIPSRPYA